MSGRGLASAKVLRQGMPTVFKDHQDQCGWNVGRVRQNKVRYALLWWWGADHVGTGGCGRKLGIPSA